ncbi:hypothetical protein N7499_009573 [Penicillium canescens]|nr:hypothetical protein N7499_009573 [Penicillium canescens]KAJ6170239.1 hypothetical protein N7485_007585 [Penicillium canescens]
MAHTSLNQYAFDKQCWVQFENETTIYFNASFYDPSCDCVAHIEADPDIAGLGVMYAFITTAFITVAVATIPAFNELRYCRRTKKNPLTNFEYHTQRYRELHLPPLVSGAIRLLKCLCDLQIITATAILIAGFVQWPEISFYHSQFVIEYWKSLGLTLDHVRVLIRRAFVFVSVVVSVAFQGLVSWRECHHWSMIATGRCYISHDKAPADLTWFWIAGTSLYGVTLLLQLNPWSRDLVKGYETCQGWILEALLRRTSEAWAVCFSGTVEEKPCGLGIVLRARSVLEVLLSGFATVIGVVFLVVIDMFSYGSVCYPLGVALYAGLSAWSTYSLVDLKHSNEILLVAPRVDDGFESSWGFGQVLPLALLVTLLFQGWDIARDEAKRSLATEISLYPDW